MNPCPLRILVVEDDATDRELYRRFLRLSETFDYEIHETVIMLTGSEEEGLASECYAFGIDAFARTAWMKRPWASPSSKL